MKVISQAEADRLRKEALRHGIVKRLTCPGRPAEILRAKKSYGCQHCALVDAARGELKPSEDQEKPGKNVKGQPSEDQKKLGKNSKGPRPVRTNESILSRRLTFDGLRSHLKAKSVQVFLL